MTDEAAYRKGVEDRGRDHDRLSREELHAERPDLDAPLYLAGAEEEDEDAHLLGVYDREADSWNRVEKTKYSAKQLRKLLKEGKAMRNAKGEPSYPINDLEDLHNAIKAVGRGSGSHDAIRRYVTRRAKAMGHSDLIPENWTSEGANKSQFSLVCSLRKADGEQRLVYGVLLEPGVRDSQGDVVSAAEIEKACHRYMEESQKADVQHSYEEAPAVLVENFVAPENMHLGDEPVQKGAWVQGWRIDDANLWSDIKSGKLTGLSMGGMANRLPD